MGAPLPIPLPRTRMSGARDSCSRAHIVPVRPKEDWTSSRMKSRPRLLAQASSFLRQPGGGKTNPAVPW